METASSTPLGRVRPHRRRLSRPATAVVAGLAAVVAVAVTVPSASAEARLLASITEGVGDAAGREVGNGCKDARQANTTVSSPTRAGKAAIRHHVESCGERAEVTGPKTDIGGTYWEGWSMYLPADFDPAGHYTIVNQWPAYPVTNNRSFRDACGGVGSKLSIGSNGSLGYDLQRPGGGKDVLCTEYDLATVAQVRGKWVDFVQQAKWTGKGDGFLRLWMRIGGGEYRKVVDHSGATWWDDEDRGPYFKTGAYLGDPGWKGKPVTLYTDEYRLAGADAAFADVAPGGDQAGPGGPGPQPTATTTAGPTPSGSAAPSGSASPAPSASASPSGSASPSESASPPPGAGDLVDDMSDPDEEGDGSIEPATVSGRKGYEHSVTSSQKRAEFSFKKTAIGTDYTYRWSLYFPSGYQETKGADIVAQWAAFPSPTKFPCGAVGHRLSAKNGGLRFDLQHATSPGSSTARCDSFQVVKPAELTGKWLDFELKARWTDRSDGYARMTLRVDGGAPRTVVDVKGSTFFSKQVEKDGPYFKMGYYNGSTSGGKTVSVYTADYRLYRND